LPADQSSSNLVFGTLRVYDDDTAGPSISVAFDPEPTTDGDIRGGTYSLSGSITDGSGIGSGTLTILNNVGGVVASKGWDFLGAVGAGDYDNVTLGIYTASVSVADADNDRDNDSKSASWSTTFNVVDDDTTAPTDPSGVSLTPNDWTNVNYFVLNFTQSSDASGILHYRASTNTPSSVSDGVVIIDSEGQFIINNAPEGELTQYLFAVDADDDRLGDRMMSGSTPFTTKLDLTPPPQIVIGTLGEGGDPSTEIIVNWTPAANAGNRAGDNAPLSPWASYRIYMTDDGTDPTYASPFVDGGYDPNLTNISRAFTTLSNMVSGLAYNFKVVGVDKAGNMSPMSDGVTVVLPGFNVTQGLARVTSGGINFSEIYWKAATNQYSGVAREYDLLWVDAPTFTDALSNQWRFLQSGWTNSLSDTGGVGRTPPSLLNGNMRFYRAALKDRWMTNRTPRVASEEVYGMKNVWLYKGQNWVAVPTIPDTNTIAGLLGFNLPAGYGMSDTNGTRLFWYQAATGQVAKKSAYLADTGQGVQWRTGIGFPQQNVNANDEPIPVNEGLLIILPQFAEPMSLLFIGRVPTNRMTQVINPNKSFNFIAMHLPATVHPSQMNLLESGFKGGATSMQSDRIRKLNRAGQSTEQDVWYSTLQQKWYYASSPPYTEATGFRIGPDDGFLIWTYGSTAEWVWTNKMLYSPPTRFMNP